MATNADWQRIGSEMVNSGLPSSYLTTIATPDVANKDTYAAFLGLFRTIASDHSDAGDMIRASLLSTVAAQ
jgi:hypothetical protein